MTVMEFFGCTFIAFGTPLALFLFTIMHDPLRIIVLMASAFFWLLALLLSSILWFAVVPLREQLAFGLTFSVLFQELFRFLFYMVLRLADEGLKRVSQQEEVPGIQLVSNRHLMAYVAGLGFGIMSGAFSLVNVLADSTGPGTIGIFGDSDLFFITSAFMTLCYVLLHIFWGIIFFAGMDRKRYYMPVIVVVSHMLISCLTLLHDQKPPPYLGTLLPAYGMMLFMAGWAFITAGGNLRSIKSFLHCCPQRYSL